MKQSINVVKYDELGTADYGWLKPHYHFSFSNYYDPNKLGFGQLLVINDDIIAGQSGFPPHPHDNMEIITYVRSGAITHKDSLGNTGVTKAGDVQVMSAGTGILHSEYNLEDEQTTLYQIWIKPNKLNVTPRWEAAQFPKNLVKDSLNLLVSGREEDEGKGALKIYQDAAIYGGRMPAGAVVKQTIKHQAYILISEGSVEVEGKKMNKGDGAEVVGISEINIIAGKNTELLIIDVP